MQKITNYLSNIFPQLHRLRKLSNYFILIFFIQLVTISCNETTTTAQGINKEAEKDLPLYKLPNTSPISPAEAARIKAGCQVWFDSTLSLKGFNGGLLIAKNGHILFEKYNGTKYIPGIELITDKTPMHIASVSKTFTAMAVLKLWQDGKLNIDDEVSKYLTGLIYPGVTIRTLLNHRSGLPNYLYYFDNLGWDKTKLVTNADVFSFMNQYKTLMMDIRVPNTHFSYCNTNYALLALIIEKVSGKTYPAFMSHEFFKPLQMNNSYVFTLKDTTTFTPSYDWKGRLMPFSHLDLVYGDKNIYTTPQDLFKWDRALKDGVIFKPEILAQAYTPYSNERPGIKNYGLGWRMNNLPSGKKIIFHNGWWHGSNAAFIRLLDEDATIIVIGNRFTRSIYGAKSLCNLFGEYFAEAEEEENTASTPNQDSILAAKGTKLPIMPLKKLTKKDSILHSKFKDLNKVKTGRE